MLSYRNFNLLHSCGVLYLNVSLGSGQHLRVVMQLAVKQLIIRGNVPPIVLPLLLNANVVALHIPGMHNLWFVTTALVLIRLR